jgi:hypothetical protein
MASAPDAFAALIAGAISSGLETPKLESSTPRRRPAVCIASRCRGRAVLESTSIAIRRARGTASIKMSCRFSSTSGESKLTP